MRVVLVHGREGAPSSSPRKANWNNHLFGKELLNSPAKAQVGNSALKWMSSDKVQVIGRTLFRKDNMSSMFVCLIGNQYLGSFAVTHSGKMFTVKCPPESPAVPF